MKPSTYLRLADLRLKPEVLQTVLSIIAEIEEPIEARKAKDRERKSKESAWKIQGNSTENPQTFHGNGAEIPMEIPLTPPLEPPIDKKESFFLTSSDSSLEKKEDLVVARERKLRANRGQIVPADLQLSIKNLETALSRGWARERAFSEWQRFKDHSAANGKAYRNVDAAWRNWVTSPFQKNGPSGQFKSMSGIDGVI